LIRLRTDYNYIVQGLRALAIPPLGCRMPAGVVHKDAPHRLRGDAEKMGAVLPADSPLIHQLQERFMDERRGLQGVVAPLAPEVAGGQPAQLGVNLRQQAVERVLAPVAPLL